MSYAWVRRVLFTTLATTTLLPLAGCDTVGPLVLQTHEHTQRAYAELAKGWLQWVMALPWSTGPLTDTTGERCGMGQQGPVFFLVGTNGGPAVRECDVPADKALYFPLINGWVIPDDQYVDEPDELDSYLSWAPGYFDSGREHTCELHLRIDGEDILPDTAAIDAELYVRVLEPFEVELNADNWATQWGKLPGVRHYALTDGHFALLQPLEPGDHVLEFGGSVCDDQGVTTFQTSAVYTLHVEEDDDCEDQD